MCAHWLRHSFSFLPLSHQHLMMFPRKEWQKEIKSHGNQIHLLFQQTNVGKKHHQKHESFSSQEIISPLIQALGGEGECSFPTSENFVFTFYVSSGSTSYYQKFDACKIFEILRLNQAIHFEITGNYLYFKSEPFSVTDEPSVNLPLLKNESFISVLFSEKNEPSVKLSLLKFIIFVSDLFSETNEPSVKLPPLKNVIFISDLFSEKMNLQWNCRF